MLPYVFLAI